VTWLKPIKKCVRIDRNVDVIALKKLMIQDGVSIHLIIGIKKLKGLR